MSARREDDASRWWKRLGREPAPRARVFFFPHAGGSAGAYAEWRALLPEAVELCLLQLPGRAERTGEEPCTRLEDFLPSLVRASLPLLDRRYVFIGHSMGALVAYELLQALACFGVPPPEALFVSAFRAPSLPPREPLLSRLPSNELREVITALGGTPDAVLADPELLESYLPVIRADFRLCEDYRFRAAPVLDIPIVALRGRSDDRVSESEIVPWRELTSASFRSLSFPGDHFYLRRARLAVAHELGAVLS